ncbi:hypothetical protein [Mucilaginibacter pedocola]|uniref:Uncharacterized protein n=1 Tax=Mucilaginibacter pedocola TaxID=1792845 RepID=A0A1S9P8X2_9SPHI|nr:hypothetical protein [Mucilaginibacter pedocola]OOQ57392.1 hypothetical protein BC343_14935 [Mucilaginibacter pedocola]
MKFTIKPYKVKAFFDDVNQICDKYGIWYPNSIQINHDEGMDIVEFGDVFIARLSVDQLNEIKSLAATH